MQKKTETGIWKQKYTKKKTGAIHLLFCNFNISWLLILQWKISNNNVWDSSIEIVNSKFLPIINRNGGLCLNLKSLDIFKLLLFCVCVFKTFFKFYFFAQIRNQWQKWQTQNKTWISFIGLSEKDMLSVENVCQSSNLLSFESMSCLRWESRIKWSSGVLCRFPLRFDLLFALLILKFIVLYQQRCGKPRIANQNWLMCTGSHALLSLRLASSFDCMSHRMN